MTAPSSTETRKTLMIVGDQILIATTLRDALQDAGYRVFDLTDRYAEVLDVAKACKPDLALVNIRLAGNEDGLKLAEKLKSLAIPVLLIGGQKNRASSAKTVAIASMPKPYDAADMVLAAGYLLGRFHGDVSLPKPGQLDDEGFGLAAA